MMISTLLCLIPLFCPAMEYSAFSLRLNEISASSSSEVLQDENGNSPDWIELYNAGKEVISLKGFYLSDGAKRLDKFAFPDAVLPAGGYLVVFCSGEDRVTETEMHTSFKLSDDGETVVLSYQGEIIDSVDTARQAKDVPLARNASGSWEKTYAPTPGKENIISSQTQPESGTAVFSAPNTVQINEVMASAAPFKNMPGYDYVELYNPGSYQNLAHWSITLTGKKEQVFTIPSGTGLGHDEYLVIYFSESPSVRLNAGFSISASYGTLTLKDTKGNIIDVLSWNEPLYGNLPYGRPSGSNEICFLETETFNRKNPASGYAKRANAPKLSVDAGFYATPFSLELKADPGETIYYTTDGSTPTRSSRVYKAPIPINQTTVLRAAAASDTAMLSDTASATYFLGLDIDVPVVSVMMDQDHLNGSVNGMMTTGNYEKDWEYPANIEYFDQNGTQTLDQLAGVTVSGEVSRRYSQKSMAFFSRKAYGDDAFAFNPFPNRDYESVQAFVLRNAGSEPTLSGIRFMDLFLTRLALNSHADVSDGQPVLVFINGEIWGHCNIRERVNKHYFASQEGIIDEDIIDNIDILNNDGIASNGDARDYRVLSHYMATHDLNDPEALAYVLTQLDVDSLFDYAAYEMICGNKDLSNTRFYRIPGGKWTWTLYDLDTAMAGTGSAPIGYFMQPLNSAPVVDFDPTPFTALMKVPEMKEKFLLRMGEIMVDYFTYDYLSKELDNMYAQMAPIMEYHLIRWPALTMEDWSRNVEAARKLLRDRPPQVVKEVQRIFNLTNEEMQIYFGEYLEKNSL